MQINSCLQALTKDISTPADIAPSALETVIFYCFIGYISALTYYLLLHRQDNQQQVCVQPPPAAVKVSLPAFAAERQQHGTRSCRSISPACWAPSSKPTARCCCCRSTGQTDGRTCGRYIDPARHTTRQHIVVLVFTVRGGSVAEWLACWTQAQKGPGSNRSRDAVG